MLAPLLTDFALAVAPLALIVPVMLMLLPAEERARARWQVAAGAAWGGFGAALISLAILHFSLKGALAAFPFETAVRVHAGLVAPIVEELAKAAPLLVLLALAMFPTWGIRTGLVIGAAVGLGFAMSENFIYWQRVAAAGIAKDYLARLAITTPMHGSLGMIVFGTAGWLGSGGRLRPVLRVVGALLLATGIHAVWNLLMLVFAYGHRPMLVQLGSGFMCLLLFVLLLSHAVLCIVARAGGREGDRGDAGV